MRNNARKNVIYSIILLLIVFIVFLYRQNQQNPREATTVEQDGRVILTGQTMGTTYRVVYLDEQSRDFKKQIDSVFVAFNKSQSTYIEDSEISRFNRQDTLEFESPYFLEVLESSREVFELTKGSFDPTIGPLVNVWGFGPEGAQRKDSTEIKDLLRLVDFNLIGYDSNQVWKTKPGVYLDFSAIAKGYGVDVVVDFLEEQGIYNMLVEIGGELVARGVNENGELWKVGINQPDETGAKDDLFSIIALDNQGLATSGNYRNFYERDGIKYSHTISPKTGFPVRHSLLSATVVAENCMLADAYATALMVMGTEEAIALQESSQAFEMLLIFNDEEGKLETFVSEGLKPFISFIDRD
ncbi:FAD:protein FMN transferase [Litoribacter alkaliphilus]|uniref:FAD:protein FMN transferase n=1 Tax=Litoribacter ruber TaxID=702568 RepID=A0AAP2CFK6_9BACT|nr:FAD:protein FMN transferase [Litoribacter alkaliphilus]MBS9523678.1 FAD:protein FMN transferase [Litoribacter alkaliphilus]